MLEREQSPESACLSMPGQPVCHGEYLSAAADLPVDNREQVEAAAQKLREQGVEQVLVKLGSEGSLLVGPEGTLYQPIVKADKVMRYIPLLSSALPFLCRGSQAQSMPVVSTGEIVVAISWAQAQLRQICVEVLLQRTEFMTHAVSQ